MKAEEDFVNSLTEPVCIAIQKAIVERWDRLNMKNAKCQPKAQLPGTSLAQYGSCVGTPFSNTNFSISTLGCTVDMVSMSTNSEAPQQKGQKEDAMSDLDTARRHMDTRMYGIKRTKRDALKVQFGLADLPSPETYADMKARLLAGQFVLPTDAADDGAYYGVSLGNIEWRDPSVKKDRPGFTAAEKLLDASANKVKDAIWVKTNPEDALALLEAFESSTVN